MGLLISEACEDKAGIWERFGSKSVGFVMQSCWIFLVVSTAGSCIMCSRVDV